MKKSISVTLLFYRLTETRLTNKKMEIRRQFSIFRKNTYENYKARPLVVHRGAGKAQLPKGVLRVWLKMKA